MEMDRTKYFEPKTYLNILLELGVALQVSFLHLTEIGAGASWYSILGPEGPLDFRSNYIQTCLALSMMGSLSVSSEDDYWIASMIKVGVPKEINYYVVPNTLSYNYDFFFECKYCFFQSCIKGGFVGLSYAFGVFICAGGMSNLPPSKVIYQNTF